MNDLPPSPNGASDAAPKNAVLVPGAAGKALFWSPLERRLPSSWTTKAIDLPGFGPVPAKAGVRSYEELVDYIADHITRPSVLLGQSMGAYLCLKLALRFPERVTHLVLSVAAGGVDMKAARASDWRPRHQGEHAGLDSWIYEPTEDLTPSLCNIDVPTLLVWAERDPLSPLRVANTLEQALPRAELLSFDTDDHWVVRRFADQIAPRVIRLVDAP